jgi:uncharacterized Zn-finger protein
MPEKSHTCPMCYQLFEHPRTIFITDGGDEIFVCPWCDHTFKSGTHVGITPKEPIDPRNLV